ncbi:MAG: hypothetical protein ACRD0K_07895 [Egibacteraceae bacterium]
MLASAAVAATLLGGGTLSASPASARSAHGDPAQASCLWQYVVTDGVFNDVLIFEHVNSTNVVGRIHPGEHFRSPNPPRLFAGNQGVRLEIFAGWVGYGNYTAFQHCE